MQEAGFLYDVLIFLVAAIIIVPVVRRLRTSPLIGYLVAGALIGPTGFGLVTADEVISRLAEFGVVFLLFAIGLELSLERLSAMRRIVFGLGIGQVLVTSVIIGVIARGFGASVEAACVIGGGLALPAALASSMGRHADNQPASIIGALADLMAARDAELIGLREVV